jgi:hypothetical protein
VSQGYADVNTDEDHLGRGLDSVLEGIKEKEMEQKDEKREQDDSGNHPIDGKNVKAPDKRKKGKNGDLCCRRRFERGEVSRELPHRDTSEYRDKEGHTYNATPKERRHENRDSNDSGLDTVAKH